MKLVILSDIHANLSALHAVREEEARWVFLGDLVDYGPRPRECIAWLRERLWKGVRGNHDEALLGGRSCRCSLAMRDLSEATRAWHSQVLGEAERAFLGSLPTGDTFEFGGARFRAVHASPRDPLYTYRGPGTPDAVWNEELEAFGADVLLYGHTHLPLVRTVGRVTVLNPGSIGQPRSGRPETSYAVWEDGRVTLHWVSYDAEETVADLESSPLSRGHVDRLSAILRTGKA